jgi:phosphopantothenoylcysteine synthetase/decarboxylase
VQSDLSGRHVLVTSGPTRADIDAVRYVSNRSSGRLGCRIAREALGRGARVTLLAGPLSALPAPGELCDDEADRLSVRRVETVPDLTAAMEAELTRPGAPDAIVHAMAVLDYVPARPSPEKTPSGREEWVVRLIQTPKVIRRVRQWAPDALLVEFKLEVGLPEEELRQAALASLLANEADLVVANDMERIRDEVHPALIIAPNGEVLARPSTKSEIARALCELLAERL